MGEKHGGRFASALKLALDIPHVEGEVNYLFYRLNLRDKHLHFDIAKSESLGNNSVCILRDAFENGISQDDLSAIDLPAINESLQLRNNYLILTTTRTTNLEHIPQVPKIYPDYKDDSQKIIFDKHLNWYKNNVDNESNQTDLFALIHDATDDLLRSLSTPYKIDIFFQQLSAARVEEVARDLYESEEKDRYDNTLEKETRRSWQKRSLIHLAKNIGVIDQELTHIWFEKIPENARLFAMLSVLLEGVDLNTLEAIYALAVNELCKDGVSTLCDPREIGRHDLLTLIHARPSEDNSIEFENPEFRNKIIKQIDNRHALLWSLIETFLKLIDNYRGREYWELRRSLGGAIGWLGIYHSSKLLPVLNLLARDDNGEVVAVAGYALDKFCQQGAEYYPFVKECLNSWTTSEDPDLMWAAAASIWRIYGGLVETMRHPPDNNQGSAKKAENLIQDIWKDLKYLASYYDKINLTAIQYALSLVLHEQIEYSAIRKIYSLTQEQKREIDLIFKNWIMSNKQSVLYALNRMANSNARDVVIHIKEWMNSHGNGNLISLGYSAGLRLFENNAKPDIQLVVDRHEPLLELVREILRIDQPYVDLVISTLLIWIQKSGWAEKVFAALLNAANQATWSENDRLRTSLINYWMVSDITEAKRIGKSIIERVYFSSGAPMEMPGSKLAIIEMDASENDGLQITEFCRQIFTRLNARLDTYILALGSSKPLALPQDIPIAGDLTRLFPQPLLLSRLPEKFKSENIQLLLPLSTHIPYNLEDLLETSFQEKVIMVMLPNNQFGPKEFKQIGLTNRNPTDGANYYPFDEKVNQQIGHVIINMSLDELWRPISKFFECEAVCIEVISEKMHTWAADLDEVDTSGLNNDHGRLLASAVSWLAKADLERCVNLVLSWLQDEENDSLRFAGMACSQMLFNIFSSKKPHSIPVLEEKILLDLIIPTVERAKNWEQIHTILKALHEWLIIPELAEYILIFVSTNDEISGHFNILIDLVDHMPAAFRNDLKELLNKWENEKSDPPEEKSIRKDDPLIAVHLTAELMLMRLATGSGGSLPELNDEQKYGLIFLDVSYQKSSALADVLVEVIKQLNEKDEYKRDLSLITYHLGKSIPVSIKNQVPVREELLPNSLPYLSRLAAPSLFHAIPRQVAFILMFINGRVIDQDDWADSWRSVPTFIVTNRDEIQFPEHFHTTPKIKSSQERAKEIIEIIMKQIKG